MTIYNFHADAIAFEHAVALAPDVASKLNILADLVSRHIENATVMQALAESNERWAKQTATKQGIVEAVVEAMLEHFEGRGEIPEFVNDLANAFDIEMTQEFTVRVKMDYTFTVTAPRGTSEQDVRANINWDGNPKLTCDLSDTELLGHDDDPANWDIEVDIA